MKIKLIYTVRSSIIGGNERTLLLILDHLIEKIIPIVIIPNSGPLQIELEKRNVKYYILEHRTKFSPRYLFKLFKIYKGSNAEILHHFSSRIDAIPAKILGLKVLETNNLSREFPKLFFNKFTIVDFITSTLIDHILAASKYIKEQLIKHYIPPRKISVVYNGVDMKKFFPINRSFVERRKHLFIIVARLDPIKGHEDLLLALKILRDEGISFNLLVIGEGDLRAHLESVSSKLNLTKCVRFIGFKTDLNKYYNLADLVLLPSHSEAFPNSILEAMAVGKVVITTSVGGIIEAIKHKENGYLVKPKNPRELAKGIREIVNDRQLREKISSMALKYAKEKFSLSAMMKDTYRIYKGLLN